jgi:hypothetical protein
MAEINEQMKELADYAIKSARERYHKDLDFSEQSLIILDNILYKIYWGFSGRTDNGGEDSLAYNTALIWGSYLGEYIILKWGGKWTQKGSEQLIEINNLKFSPVKFVYQKISEHPDTSVEDYINDAKGMIYTSVVNRQAKQEIKEKKEPIREQLTVKASEGPIREQLTVKPSKKPVRIEQRTIYLIGGIIGALIIIAGCITGYTLVKSGGLPAFAPPEQATSTNTSTSTGALLSPTFLPTDTPIPTATLLPTYTPLPTDTPIPTFTPSLTSTEIPSSTPTDTQTPFIPTNTPRPTYTRTYTPVPPTPKPTTVPPTPTNSPPTNTQPPPPTIKSCGVNPSSINWGEPTTLTFRVEFSAPGYGINGISFQKSFPGQAGCSVGGGGDTTVSCQGNSGMVSPATKVDVTIQTPLGDCATSYSTP